MPIGVETYHFQPFPVVHGACPDHELLSPLHVVLELLNLSQSIPHTHSIIVSVPYRGLALTVPELWAAKIRHHIRAKRKTPSATREARPLVHPHSQNL